MSGAGLGFDISGLPPAIHPTDGRRSAEVENARRLACTFAGLDKLNRPRPEVLGVSLRHRMPPHVAAEIPNLICEPKGIPRALRFTSTGNRSNGALGARSTQDIGLVAAPYRCLKPAPRQMQM